MSLLLLDTEDNVAVALRNLAADEVLRVGVTDLRVATVIPQGHKVARRVIAEDEAIIKYGVPVGRATRAIAAGEHVHCHNVGSLYFDNVQDHHE